MLKLFKYKLKIILDGSADQLQGLLGSQASREIAQNYVLAKSIDKGFEGKNIPADELQALTPAEEMEGKTTVFHKVDGKPVIFNYQIKGFIKESANCLKDQIKLTWPQARATQGIFILPRTIALKRPDGKYITAAEITKYERSLRAMTMQGPRVSIAVSEWIKPPIMFEVELHLIGDKLDEDTISMILDYGQYCGLGQFRSGGFGSFSYELTPLQDEKPSPSNKVKRGKAAKEDVE
jgi:hypothetical protein